MLTLGVGQMWGSVTFSKSDFSFTDTQVSGNPISASKNGVTITCTAANIPSSGSYVTFSKSSTLTISSSSGNITAIDFTTSGSGYTGNMTDVSDLSTTEWSTTVSCEGQKTTVRVSSIVVTVEASCTVKPTVGADLTSVSATANSITATVPISSIGGCNITENGLVYSSSVTTPTVGAANCTKVTTTACGATAANKTVTISDLACSTTYYVRGYATNDAGIQYTTNTKTQATSACPKYTVTLKDDDTELEQATAGASVTLPSRTGCTGYTFAGWTKSWTTAQSSWTTTAPTIINAGSYTPQADENLYPVYTKTEAGSGADTYQRVSSTAAVTDGQYLIVCEGQSKAFNGGASNLDATPNFISVTISSNTITASETTTAAEFTIGTSGDNRTITSATGYTIGRTGTTNGFESSNTSTLTNTITISSNNAIITSSGGPKLQYLNSGNNSKFRYYASSQTAIQLYKRISSSVTSYISVPNCCTSLGSINGSFLGTTHFGALSPEKFRPERP